MLSRNRPKSNDRTNGCKKQLRRIARLKRHVSSNRNRKQNRRKILRGIAYLDVFRCDVVTVRILYLRILKPSRKPPHCTVSAIWKNRWHGFMNDNKTTQARAIRIEIDFVEVPSAELPSPSSFVVCLRGFSETSRTSVLKTLRF